MTLNPKIIRLLAVLGVLGLLAISQASTQAPLDDEPSPFVLLERMAKALKTTDFEGTFVYHHGDVLSALRIVHRYQDGDSQESLLTLTGPVRALGRNEDSVACLLSGGQAILLDNPDEDDSTTRDWSQLEHYYRFTRLSTTRVAGRSAILVDIRPRDNLRYGYRFAIDLNTYFPLHTALTEADGRLIQQLMFTDVRLSPNTAPAAQRASSAMNRSAAAVNIRLNESRWRFGPLPAGFALIEHDFITEPVPHEDRTPPGEYFLFSDGLASVSLYAERTHQAGLTGRTHMAGVHAAGKRLDGYQLTAVGEVPAATVAAVLEAVVAVSQAPATTTNLTTLMTEEAR